MFRRTPPVPTALFMNYTCADLPDLHRRVSIIRVFSGLIEKLPYIKQLGVTAIELMPVFDFDEKSVKGNSPVTGLPLTNFWGYDPISFFAPQSSYCVSPDAATHVREFRDFVKAAHRHGLEVILDVVYNHTGEDDQDGPAINFKGIDNSVFYFLNPTEQTFLSP